MEVEDIHVRYEDDTTSRDNSYSMGVTLERLSLTVPDAAQLQSGRVIKVRIFLLFIFLKINFIYLKMLLASNRLKYGRVQAP